MPSLPHAPEPCLACEPAPLPGGAASGCWRCGDVLLRRLSSKRGHLLQKPPGIAFHADFWQAQRPGLRWIVAVDVDTGRAWVALADDFDRNAITISRGCGLQMALPFRFWAPVRQGNGQELAKQLALALESAP